MANDKANDKGNGGVRFCEQVPPPADRPRALRSE